MLAVLDVNGVVLPTYASVDLSRVPPSILPTAVGNTRSLMGDVVKSLEVIAKRLDVLENQQPGSFIEAVDLKTGQQGDMQTCLPQPSTSVEHLSVPSCVESGAVLPRRIADAEAATAICSIAGDVLVFQQDNAPAHRAHDTVELLRSETPQFISPDMWPANSPDLNLINYHICGMLQERVYRVPIRDMDKLRKRLVATWAEFQQSVVERNIPSVR